MIEVAPKGPIEAAARAFDHRDVEQLLLSMHPGADYVRDLAIADALASAR